jgi:thiol-disulfide isomerase/thioredoxin
MLKKIQRFIPLTLAVFFVSGVLSAQETVVRPAQERVEPPPFTLKSPDGKEFSLSDFKGNVVLLDFWATWCPPCRMATPQLVQLSEKFKKQKVSILGINLNEDPKDVPAFIKQFKIPYTILLGGDAPVQAQYGIQSLPSFILLDKSLRVVDATLGFSPELPAIWEAQIKLLLKER